MCGVGGNYFYKSDSRERKEQKSEDNWRHFLPVLLLLNKGNEADAGK